MDEIQKKKTDLEALGAKDAQLEKQIAEAQQAIEKAQQALADSMTDGKGKSEAAALKALLAGQATLQELQAVRSAVGVRLTALLGELKSARVLNAEELAKEIKVTYETTMIDLITSLESVWVEACRLADLKSEARRAIAFTAVPDPIVLPSFVGDFNPERFSHFSLQSIETKFPDLFKRSGCVNNSTRTDRYRVPARR
jgi:hypothetical protein